MTNFLVEDFKLGLDVRRDPLTSQPGSLQQLDNCVITAGGEIEKRKAFVPVYTLPSGVFGIYGYPLAHPHADLAFNIDNIYPEGVLYFIRLHPVPETTPIFTNVGSVRLNEHWMNTSTIAGGGNYTLPSTTTTFGGAAATGLLTGYPNYFRSMYVVVRLLKDGDSDNPFGGHWYNFYNGNYVNKDRLAPAAIGQKMYTGGGFTVYFSGVGDPTDNNPLNPSGTGPNTTHPGAGFIDLNNLDSQFGSSFCGFGAYYKQTAVFSYSETMLFSLDPDPSQNQLTQILGIGCVGATTACPFQTGELIFAAPQGVRIMRALNSAMTAAVNDVGAPVDRLISAELRALPLGGFFCQAIIEPMTGRYWLGMGNHIYVLNYWPSAKIAAWSRFVLPFNVDGLARAGNHIFVLSGNTLYQYGGLDDSTYDSTTATVVTPYHSTGTPNVKKKALSINAMVRGNWQMSVSMSPEQSGFYEPAVNLSAPSYMMQELPYVGTGTHVGFKFTTSDASPVLLGSVGVRFDKSYEK